MDQLFPHAGDHSIQNAVLAVEWSPEIDATQLESIRGAAHGLVQDFKEETQQTIRVSFSNAPGNVPTSAPAPEISGYAYSRFSPAGELQKQVQISRGSCLIVVADYQRWKQLIADVKSVFAVVLSALPASVTISTVGLQYSDRFIWKANAETLDLREVFRANSPYLTAHSLDCKQAWHSHHGYFEKSVVPTPHNRLDIININVVDEPSGRAIQVLTSHRAALDGPLQAAGALDQVVAMQDALHDLNKGIFRELLTEPLLQKIHLNGN
ncbi:MAG: TIGR04255 family protein [Caldilineaceae bacterium]|nr:TIGR04255 family protein [Caldilineaceae bacterium]